MNGDPATQESALDDPYGTASHGYGALSAATVRQLAVAHPQPIHMELSRCPVRQGDDGVLISGAEHVAALCRRRDVAGPSAVAPALGTDRPVIPLELDGPEHAAFRRLLDPLFAPRRVAALEPAIRSLADELIDGFVDEGSAEVYSRFCEILPSTVFLRFIGLPMSDYDELQAFKEGIIRHVPAQSPEQALDRKRAATRRFQALMTERIAERRRSPRSDDLLGALLDAEVDGERLSETDILAMAHTLVVAGLDTVAASLSLDLCWLAQHPAERRALVRSPERWATAVEELLRFETVLPTARRYAMADLEVAGEVIPAGTKLTVSWASVNLDPDLYPDPLAVDLDRAPNMHATFALGFHRCLGSHLARLELRVALDQFHRRIPDYEIEAGAELRYEPLPVRLVRPLPLRWR